jgi:hypothetical protein
MVTTRTNLHLCPVSGHLGATGLSPFKHLTLNMLEWLNTKKGSVAIMTFQKCVIDNIIRIIN